MAPRRRKKNGLDVSVRGLGAAQDQGISLLFMIFKWDFVKKLCLLRLIFLDLSSMPTSELQSVGVEIRNYIEDEERIIVKRVTIHHGHLLILVHLEDQPIRK